ncbi:MAG: hypothetical protein HQL53_04005 [Magnetococcales bacterium]|nr:hypothetical protein [Magnetococcales bacterium]
MGSTAAGGGVFALARMARPPLLRLGVAADLADFGRCLDLSDAETALEASLTDVGGASGVGLVLTAAGFSLAATGRFSTATDSAGEVFRFAVMATPRPEDPVARFRLAALGCAFLEGIGFWAGFNRPTGSGFTIGLERSTDFSSTGDGGAFRLAVINTPRPLEACFNPEVPVVLDAALPRPDVALRGTLSRFLTPTDIDTPRFFGGTLWARRSVAVSTEVDSAAALGAPASMWES